MNDNELNKLQQDAEKQAADIIAKYGFDQLNRLERLRDDIDRLGKNIRRLKREVDKISVLSGLHERISIASIGGKRIDPVTDLNAGLMLDRMYQHERRN